MSSDKPFEPTLSDVLVVRAMLAKTTILPELVGTILDYAEYWARSSAKAELNAVIAARLVGQGEFDYEENQFLVRQSPTGDGEENTNCISTTNKALASILPCRPDGARL